jgi:uncharacterized protein (PEP-CTERM system associated)
MRRICDKSILCGLLVFTVVASNPASAAIRWDGRISVTPRISLTDNVCLDDDNKKVGWTSGMSIAPTGAITANTRRTQMSLSGAINMNSLTNSYLKSKGCDGDYRDRSQYNPRLEGLLKTSFFANLVKFNAKLKVRENEVSSRFVGAGDEYNRAGNSNTYTRYSLTPSVAKKFGKLVNANLGYTWDEVLNSNRLVRDSNRHRATLTFKSAWKSDFSHNVGYNYSRTQYDEDILGVKRKDTELSKVRYQLRYQLRNWVSVRADAGRSFNSYQTLGGRKNDGNSWTADVLLTPRETTSLSIGLQDRYFGQTPTLDFRHQGKFSQIGLSYSEKLTFNRDIRTEDDELFDEFYDEDLGQLGNASDFSTLPIVDTRLSGVWTYSKRKSTISLVTSLSEQERQLDGRTADFKSVSLSYRPRLNTTMNLTTRIEWREDEPIDVPILIPLVDPDAKSEVWSFSVTGSRPLGRRSTTSLTYRFTDRSSESGSSDYQENRITASVGINF